jgi:hypothetical protein
MMEINLANLKMGLVTIPFSVGESKGKSCVRLNQPEGAF